MVSLTEITPVPLSDFREGQVIKMHNWYAVILAVHFAEDGELSLLQVQTARNIFRGFGPEFIDVRLNTTAVQPASLADLEQEIKQHKQLQESALHRLYAQIIEPEP